MTISARLGRLTAAMALAATPALADYDTHPELSPENRCVTADGTSLVGTLDCQRLFWDLPPTTELGAIRVSAQFGQDPIPRFPHGDVDRIPPLFVADEDGDGVLEGFEKQAADGSRHRLCEDPLDVTWWEPIVDENRQPVIGTAGETFEGILIGGTTAEGEIYAAFDDPGTPGIDESEHGNQTGPLFRIACRRGSRSYFGPWQTAGTNNDYDRLTKQMMMRIENTAHLDADEIAGRLVDRDGDGVLDRVGWATGSEFYNHFASHHGTCWLPQNTGLAADCSNPDNPQPREAFNDENGHCRPYQAPADVGGSCSSEGADVTDCKGNPSSGAFQNATQVPGRLYIEVPDGRGILGVEDQILNCNHHVVTQLPPGSYSMEDKANFRITAGGLRNPRVKGVDCEAAENDPATPRNETRSCKIYGVDAGEIIGGSVGEMIMQAFNEPYLNDEGELAVRPANTAFIAATDAVTSYYAPFTWNYHTALWFPPFDANIGLTTIHSHHRMVKGVMNILPANKPRLNSPDPFCGGIGSTDMYTNWEWEDARVCEYWKDPDGPVVIRKGEALATTCYVNNGVTPEALKHGLVAGSMVETLKNMGAPIPDYIETVPANTWGDILADSPVGDQLLYGTHPPVNYRVVYKCATEGFGSSMMNIPTYQNHAPCDANPATDPDGDYIDGAYLNGEQCGYDASGAENWCEPSSIIFACVGEDEMCIGVALYWSLDRLGDTENGGHDRAVAAASEGDVDKVGTPGNTSIPGDYVAGGSCPECGDRPSF